MNAIRPNFKALGFFAVVALLTACGGTNTAINSAVPQGLTAARQRDHVGRSWMLPEAKGEDLLYATNQDAAVYVFSYPGGKLVGKLTAPGFSATLGDCVDENGNVFITNTAEPSGGVSGVVEFAHGGTTPIEALTGYGLYAPRGCSVDPVTGDLAVADGYYDLAIYQDAEGTPTHYVTYDFVNDCVYDGDGDLFLAEGANNKGTIQELRYGSTSLETISLNKAFAPSRALQWDGQYLDMSTWRNYSVIYQIAVSGSTGSVANDVVMKGTTGQYAFAMFGLQQNTLIEPTGHHDQWIDLFNYPGTGKPVKVIKSHNSRNLYGVAVSVAPSRSRRR